MANIILTADSLGVNITYTFGTGDLFVLAAGTRLVGTGYSYIYGTTPGTTVTIDGYVWLQGNTGGSGSPFFFVGGDTITIGADAQMTLLSGTFGGWAAVTFGAGNVGGTLFTNNGHITSLAGEGFAIKAGANRILNHGTIDLAAGVMRFDAAGNDSLTNTGTITGIGNNSQGLVDVLGASFTLTNSGDIVTGTGTYAIRDTAASGTSVYANAGTIAALAGIGMEVQTANATVYNSGTISGLYTAMILSGNSNYVRNTGTINGTVFLGNGGDTFDGIGGTTNGTIVGGQGSDTYFTSDSGMVISEAAGLSNDTVYATVNFRLATQIETLRLLNFAITGIGNTSSNTVVGNGADNRLYGLAGTDNMLGAEGDDLLGGGDGNDTLQGGDGDDWLRGAAGNDSLIGGGDNDTLIGAIGADTLTGSTGSDRFVFLRQSDSGVAVATSDLIKDFVRGQDVIDLFGIDARTTNAIPNDAFTLIGTAAFSNVAGQLRYSSAAGVTTLQMDVNGNGTADMILRLTGTLVLTAQDFVL